MKSLAAPPINDFCTNAIVIPPTGPFPYVVPAVDITEATTVGDPLAAPRCQTNAARSIWYVFTPASDEVYTISTCSDATTAEDTIMAVYTTPVECDPAQFVLQNCADDSPACFRKAAITMQMFSDTKYYIVVWQYSVDLLGLDSVELSVKQAEAPFNDSCAQAMPVLLEVPVIGTTFAARNDYQLSGTACFTGLGQRPSTAPGRDVVYTFQAPAADTYSIKVYNYNYDPNELVIYVASQCPNNPAPATVTGCLGAANRVVGGTAEEIYCLALGAGQQIYIYVDEAYSPLESPGSDFTLEVTRCRLEVEPNSGPTNANPICSGTEGSILNSRDEDYFSLGTFAAGSRVFAMTDASAARITSFSLEVRTATNVIEIDSGDNAETFGETSSNVGGTIVPAEPVYLRVFNSVQNDPYRLYAVVQPPITMATLETEPNNDYWDANYAANNYFRGTLNNLADVDVFSFNAGASNLIFVSLDCDPLRNLTPINGKLELLDGNGKVLVAVDDSNSFSDSSSSPSEALVYRTAEEGTFYVRVSASIDAVISGDYLLSISKNCYIGELGLDTAPVLTSAAMFSIGEGGNSVLDAQITDPDTGEAFKAVINWGDGSTELITNLPAGLYGIHLPHIYTNDGTYPVSVVVSDYAGLSFSTNLSAQVANSPPSTPVLQLSASNIFENDMVILDGTFMDPGVLDAHVVTINWGDGSANSTINLAAGLVSFSDAHRYRDDNPTATSFDSYTITVSVADEAGSSSETLPLLVSNVPPVLSDVAITSPILPNQMATLTGNLSDTGAEDALTLQINWGDGAPMQTVPLSAGATSFNVQHLYTAANNNISVAVILQDDDGGSASETTNLVVQMPAIAQLAIGWSNSLLWLRVEGTPGVAYQLQQTSNLRTWDPFGSVTIGAGGFSHLTLTNPPASPPRFFRAAFQ